MMYMYIYIITIYIYNYIYVYIQDVTIIHEYHGHIWSTVDIHTLLMNHH